MDLHPLIIPEIVTNIFQFLDTSELFTVRQVCRIWNNETNQFIAHRKLICIHSLTKLEELYKLILKNDKMPLRSFELWSFPVNLDNETVLKHISACGPYFHHLTLNFDKDDRHQITLRALRDLFLYHLPNLKSLSIRQLPTSILSQDWLFPPQGKFRQPLLSSLKSLTLYSDFDYNPNFLLNFLSSTMNLEEIHVEYGDEPRDFKKSFLAALFSCGHQLQLLKSLQYFMHDPGSGPDWSWDPEECTKLAEMKFPLTSIKMHPGGEAETRSLFRLLEKLSPSLEYLKLRVHDQLRCPQMKMLTSIILYDYEGSLQFLDQLPNVMHLGLCEYSPAKNLTVETIVSTKQHFGIISLNLYGSNTVSSHIFRAIASKLPMLKILNFWHINDEKLRIVMESFPLLEELTVNVVNVNDETFTGISLDVCEKMERLGNYAEVVNQQPKFRMSNIFIGHLKNLRRLEMHGACLADWKWSPISDVSMYLGLTHLENLTSLSLYEFKWITDNAIRKICETLPLLHLKIDSRAFSESLLAEIKKIRPEMRLEYVTDEFESYSTFFSSMLNV